MCWTLRRREWSCIWGRRRQWANKSAESFAGLEFLGYISSRKGEGKEPQGLYASVKRFCDDSPLRVCIELPGEHDAPEYPRSNRGTSQSGRACPRCRFCRARQRGSSNRSRAEQKGSRTLDERPSAVRRNGQRSEDFKQSVSPWETACAAGPCAGATALKLTFEGALCAIQARQASLPGWPRLPH